jgi:hypothetical protein
MEKTPTKRLYDFFIVYWDDHICGPSNGERVFVNARTLRVLGEIYGCPLLKQLIQAWAQDGDVVILNDWETSADAEARSVEILDYVREKCFESDGRIVNRKHDAKGA